VPERPRAITARSVLLGLLLAGGLVALTPYNDYVVGNTYIAGNHFPVGAVFLLLVLSLLNLIVHRRRGRALLSAGEIGVIYIIIMVTSGIPSSGLLRYMIPVSTAPFYYANPGNRWDQILWGYIPTWLGVDGEAATWFWEGLPEGAGVPWGRWWTSLSRWGILFGSFWLMMVCLAALVRRQWVDRERLTFPLVQFPVEVLRADERGPSAPFFRNRLVWIGSGLVFVVHVVNGLHQYFPAIPAVPTFWDISGTLPGRPWNAAAPLYLGLFFSAIGFGYLLSLEVACGFWFSVLYIKLQGIALAAIGYEGGSAWGGAISQVSMYQQMGGLLALAFVLIWFLRGTFADALRKTIGRAPEVEDEGEPVPYRLAMVGLLVGLGVSYAWLLAAGMTPAFAALALVFFLCIVIVLTRIVAEAGILMIHVAFAPTDYLLMFGGSTALGPGNLTALTFVDCALTFDLREFLMPSVLNAFRLSESQGVSPRRMVPIIAVALIVCVLIAAPVYLLTFYRPGAAQVANVVELDYHPRRFIGTLASRLEAPVQPGALGYISAASGVAIVSALAWLRLNYVWWPVHPLGFVMATSWASLNLWFALFLGWLLKLLTIHYGGLRGYVQFRPLAMGIIMGDILGGVLWIIAGFFTGIGIMVTVN